MARTTENNLMGYAIIIEPPATVDIAASLREHGIKNIHVTPLVKTLQNGAIHRYGNVFEGISVQNAYMSAIDNLLPMVGDRTVSCESQILLEHEVFQTGLIFPDTAEPPAEQILTNGNPLFITRNLN